MLIQVLGTGCAKCAKLATLAEDAAKQSGIDFTLEKVTDINKIVALGVMTTPALIVDGKLKCSGNVPSVEQLVKMFTEPVA
jgi:small redox-active disulfide protein 2